MSPQHGQKGDPHGKRMPKRMPPKKMPRKHMDDDEMEKRRKKRTLSKFASEIYAVFGTTIRRYDNTTGLWGPPSHTEA